PDYELYLNGIHAKRGISCADCHMPYISEGGQKFTSHHIGSPLSNVSSSCQVCHREETNKLIADVYERQDKIASIRHELEKLLVRAHVEAKAAWDAGARKEQMQEILTLIRHAQWRWDFAAASHGASFHAPLEVSRIISNGIEKAQEARIKLSRVLASLGKNAEIPMPDIASKEKAQTFIGLDMNTLRKDKAQFIKNVVTDWDNK
ncbi:MAG: ammonia-forming cytochrome c nitrite reductase subunit c552, partial [Bacteroidales bacterium]|nr:ammonia-forming cytochrome c nitrite reductase subunit c552 [Bacteroidales bacterium]